MIKALQALADAHGNLKSSADLQALAAKKLLDAMTALNEEIKQQQKQSVKQEEPTEEAPKA